MGPSSCAVLCVFQWINHENIGTWTKATAETWDPAPPSLNPLFMWLAKRVHLNAHLNINLHFYFVTSCGCKCKMHFLTFVAENSDTYHTLILSQCKKKCIILLPDTSRTIAVGRRRPIFAQSYREETGVHESKEIKGLQKSCDKLSSDTLRSLWLTHMAMTCLLNKTFKQKRTRLERGHH